MSTTLIRRIGSAASVLVAFFALMPAAQAAPADDERVNTEVAGVQAALVRIKVITDVTIAHINHSTGDVVIHQGTYEVPQAEATGVLVTGDGVVATLYRLLRENLDVVTVPAANRLFVEQIGAQLVDGNNTRGRTHATDPALDEHLQHCYQRVEHCVVVPHARYEVVLLSADQQDPVPATLINEPSGPTDVALLRVGAGGLPTASLSPTEEAVDDAAVVGLTWAVSQSNPGTRAWQPADVSARLRGSTLTGSRDLTTSLAGGLNGGPVIDRATGGVLALADCDPATNAVSAVGAASVEAALIAADIPTARSGFDIAFADGLTQMNQHEYAAAVERLEAATTYFDSALARQYLEVARERANAEEDAADTPIADGGGIAWWMWGLVALLVLAALAAGLLIGRRRRPAGPDNGPARSRAAGPSSDGADHDVVAPPRPRDGTAPAEGTATAAPRHADE
ncbi:trypsin-like peptidase domain-containing protein [Geodermatophilus sp. URMC 64]